MALGELKNGIGPDAYAIYQQVLAAVVERDHPVGSLYISENATSPAELYGGTWERIEDCTIWGASDTHPAGTKLEAGLPNITGAIYGIMTYSGGGGYSPNQALTAIPEADAHSRNTSGDGRYIKADFDASHSSPIYGASDTVQPPAYCLYLWRRVA